MKRQNYFKDMTNKELSNMYICYIKTRMQKDLIEEPLLKCYKKYRNSLEEKYAYVIMVEDLKREICRRFIQQDKCIWCE